MVETPQKKRVDYPFLLVLIFVIAIGGYWIVQEIRSQNLDPFLDFLGDKLIAMLPQEKDKQKVQTLYNEFKENVKDNKIAPEEVEEFAAEILNLHNLPDSLTAHQAEELLASVLPRPDRMPTPIEKQDRETREILPQVERKKWRALSDKLGTISEFENKLQEENLIKKFQYRIDKGLQIIVDARSKDELMKAKEKELIVTLENLEKDNLLIWSEDLAKDFQNRLDSISVVIDTYSDSIRVNRIKVPEIRVSARVDSILNKNFRSPQRSRSSSK